MATSTNTSSPGAKLLRTLPRPDDRTVGRTPGGRRIVMEPETVLAVTGPLADEPMLTDPLTDRTWTVPLTLSTATDPDVVEISASPVAPTVMRPLVVETRHLPAHSSSTTAPEIVRRSASATAATWIEPLCDVTPTVPHRPRSSTWPERVPTTTSAPSRHLTSIDAEGRPAADLNGSVGGHLDGAAAIDDHIGTPLGDDGDAAGDSADSQAQSGISGRRHHGQHCRIADGSRFLRN